VSGDLAALQGCWNTIALEVEGQDFPPGSARIVIEGERFLSKGMGAEFEGIMSVNETASPKTFDVHFDKGPHAGKASLGIYELNGDELNGDEWKICIGMAGKKRPERFVTAKGTGHALETLRRGAEAALPDSAAPIAAGGPTELEGEWRLLSCIQNGKPLAKNYTQYTRREFRGGRTTLFIGDQNSAESRFVLNAPEIDYTDLDQAGIYELSGDRLRISMASRGGDRPNDYSAAKGDGRTVTKWKLRSR
jgi:uncharacterized protein (TIGR03067 family)